MTRIRVKNHLEPAYLAYILHNLWAKGFFANLSHRWVGQAAVSASTLSTIQIPLPPLEIQRQIVAEIEGYQRIIDGARQVVENWKPNIEMELEEERKKAGVEAWERVKLGEVCKFEYGKGLKAENRIEGQYPVYGSNGIVGYHNNYLVEAPFLIIGRKGSAGEIHYSEKNGFPIDTTFYIKFETENKVLLKFLYFNLKNLNLKNLNTQAGVPGLNRNDAYKITIPIPPIKHQVAVINRIEAEGKIIEANQKLINRYEEKIKKVIERVWEA
jgi:restriction endonuclease S subunit